MFDSSVDDSYIHVYCLIIYYSIIILIIFNYLALNAGIFMTSQY